MTCAHSIPARNLRNRVTGNMRFLRVVTDIPIIETETQHNKYKSQPHDISLSHFHTAPILITYNHDIKLNVLFIYFSVFQAILFQETYQNSVCIPRFSYLRTPSAHRSPRRYPSPNSSRWSAEYNKKFLAAWDPKLPTYFSIPTSKYSLHIF